MASEVAPGYALRTASTTLPAEPNPGETVVSRAPKTWTSGQFCARALPPTRRIVAAVKNIVGIEKIITGLFFKGSNELRLEI